MTSGSTKWSDRVQAAAAVGVFSDPVVEHLRKPARDRHFEPAAERIENRLISSTGGHRGERPRLVRPSVARMASRRNGGLFPTRQSRGERALRPPRSGGFLTAAFRAAIAPTRPRAGPDQSLNATCDADRTQAFHARAIRLRRCLHPRSVRHQQSTQRGGRIPPDIWT